MAKAHVYVRVQVEGSDADCSAIAEHVASLRTLIEAAGWEWKGDCVVQLDEPPAEVVEEPAPAPAAAEVTDENPVPPTDIV